MKDYTQLQLQNRKKANIKILKYGCLPIVLIIVFAIFIISISNNTEKKEPEKVKSMLITKADLGDKYPFKKDSLKIICRENGRIIVWEEHTPNAWALNGTALQVAKENRWGSVKDDDIWNGKDLAHVLSLGLELCN